MSLHYWSRQLSVEGLIVHTNPSEDFWVEWVNDLRRLSARRRAREAVKHAMNSRLERSLWIAKDESPLWCLIIASKWAASEGFWGGEMSSERNISYIRFP